ncbi:sugar ABC transporter substrate-binding protein [Streptomyces sp. NPDC057382]|uniref:sugar ABC transporter substrate-binding protein n=1 Tax=unclassified Streptomyces TaxID=2593676 RepID=UPI003640EE93
MKKNRKLSVRTVSSAVALLALSACGQEGDGASSATGGKAKGGGKNGEPTVCLVMKSLGNEYFQAMQKGAEAHVAKRGDLKLKASGIQNETDIDGQVAAINGCITDQVDALVVAPADSRALVAPLGRAVKAGIKVINIDVKLDDGALESTGLDIPFVGPDNTEGARLSGKVLGEALGKGAKVVILEGNPGAANAQQRKAGFEAAAKAAGLTVVDSKTAHWETDEAYTVMSNWLTKHPDIKGVLASNDSMALGAIKAIQAKQSKIKIASFDNIEAIRPYVKEGTVLATLDQYGAEQAANGIDEAMKAIKGEDLQTWVKTEIKVVTAEDLG